MKSYNEFSAESVLEEIACLRRFLKAANVSKEKSLGWTSLKFLEFVIEYELSDSVPNHTFFLTLCVSISSRERSFFKLKLIKNYLRSTMNQGQQTHTFLI